MELTKGLPIIYAFIVLGIGAGIVASLPKALNLLEGSLLIASSHIETPAPVIRRVQVIKNHNLPAPLISAASVFIKDLDSGYIFYDKDSHKRLPIASTTKLMTALVASEYFSINDELIVGDLAGIDGSNIGLKPGEKLTFRSLLYGMLLNSGNDAAYTIAQNFPGGTSLFIDQMNKVSLSLNLKNTHFDNPAGFDSDSHYSSAYDLAIIAQAVSNNPQLAYIVSIKETSVASLDKTNVHQLKNLNKLLEIPGIIGMKTGFTPIAKENLVALMDRNGHRIISVVLGSDDRFGESQKLFEWVKTNFYWEVE